MSRINRNHRTTACLCFVHEKLSKLMIAPTVHPSPLLTSTLFCAMTNVRQVFNGDGAAFGRGLHNLLAEYVVTVTPEPCLRMPQPSQMTFGRPCALLLQLSPQVKVFAFNGFPAALPKKLSARRDGRLREAQVNANDGIRRLHIRSENRDNHMQPPRAIMQQEVCTIGGTSSVLASIDWQSKRDVLASCNRGKVNGLCLPVYAVGMHVVARRTSEGSRLRDGARRVFHKLQGAPYRFGCLDPRLNMQVRYQRRKLCFERIVERVVQRDAVFDALSPAMFSNRIEHLSKLTARFTQGIGLLWTRLQLDTNSTLHNTYISPYAERYCNTTGGAHSPVA